MSQMLLCRNLLVPNNDMAMKLLSHRLGSAGERVQKRIAYWDKQNNDVPAPNCMLKVRGEIIKNEGYK